MVEEDDCGVAEVEAVALPDAAACDGVTADAPPREDGDCLDEFDATRVNKDADAAAKPRMGDTAANEKSNDHKTRSFYFSPKTP